MGPSMEAEHAIRIFIAGGLIALAAVFARGLVGL